MWKSVHLVGDQKQPPNWQGHRQFGLEQRGVPLFPVIELQSGCRRREMRKKKGKVKSPTRALRVWATQIRFRNYLSGHPPVDARGARKERDPKTQVQTTNPGAPSVLF